MNPIEFLKQNGHDPDNFRTSVPQGPAFANSAVEYNHTAEQAKPRKRAFKQRIRRRNISVVRQELCAEYLATGNRDLTGLFLCWLMADVVNVCNAKYLCRKETFRHKERKHYSGLMDSWTHFNQDLLAGFSEDDKSKVTDMIDHFGDYIENEVEIFRLNIIGCIMDLDDKFRTVCGALCVCKLMISQARRAWEGMHRSQSLRDDAPTLHLASMEHHIIELMNEYFKRESHNLNRDVWFSTETAVRQAEENVIKKILKFLDEYKK